MRLNSIAPAVGAKTAKVRVGRGGGSGLGKTCGRGHKGQKARAGGYHKVGFEGGQMPLQRRLPKFGFISRKKLTRAEIKLADLEGMQAQVVDFATLRLEGIIANNITAVKVVLSGVLNRAITVKLPVTRGAKAAIEKAGGKVEQ